MTKQGRLVMRMITMTDVLRRHLKVVKIVSLRKSARGFQKAVALAEMGDRGKSG